MRDMIGIPTIASARLVTVLIIYNVGRAARVTTPLGILDTVYLPEIATTQIYDNGHHKTISTFILLQYMVNKKSKECPQRSHFSPFGVGVILRMMLLYDQQITSEKVRN
jgi:hypothetical protein